MRAAHLVLTAAAGMLFAIGASGEPLRDVIDDLAGAPEITLHIEQVNAAARGQFDAALAQYDRHIADRPYDVVGQLRRCRFFEEFVANYEYAEFADEIQQRADDCTAALSKRFPDHPEVVLWELSRMFGEEALERGVKLLGDRVRDTWTPGQLGRLYAMLAHTADANEKPDLALHYALLALDFDEESDVRLIAATRLMALKNRARALEILLAPIDGSNPADGWALTRKMDLLVEAQAPQAAMATYERLRKLEAYGHTDAAKSLRSLGAIELARHELELAAEQGEYTTEDEKERFRFELEVGSAEQAQAAYDAWRDEGWAADPLGVNRVALFAKHPTLPIHPRDLLGLAGLLLAIAACALATAVPIAAVHYWGLVARLKSGEPYPVEGWQLRHCWAALFAFAIASILALYVAGAVDVTSGLDLLWEIDATSAQLARMMTAESLIAIALLLPLAFVARTRHGAWWGANWTIGKSIGVGVGLAAVFRIPLLLAWAARPEIVRIAAPDDFVWQLISGVREHYGLVTALWVLAVAAPVTEEFIFRGVLYRAFAAHLRPLWANVLQAALFAAVHMNLKGSVYLFIVGLVLGTLTRRSAGLVAPIAMHAVFNLIGGLLLLLPIPE